ncbi:hypothetical protein HOLleu_17380 [Holothuria leucospilota]|uniref:Uncharacterized protein n=1 Tax=Holothuria leucospilota TaxID=206669 RepID=A0A9Q1C7S0_HOLLE|nr:hypothetical protein HOLleu_17380 [Holothuria leucospilota]
MKMTVVKMKILSPETISRSRHRSWWTQRPRNTRSVPGRRRANRQLVLLCAGREKPYVQIFYFISSFNLLFHNFLKKN